MAKDFDQLRAEVRERAVRTGRLDRLDALEQRFRLGVALIRRRRELGLTQAALSEKCGVVQSEVSRLERGLGNPSLQTILAITTALGLELGVSERTVIADSGGGGPTGEPASRADRPRKRAKSRARGSFSQYLALQASGPGSEPGGGWVAKPMLDIPITVTVAIRPTARVEDEMVPAVIGETPPVARPYIDLPTLERLYGSSDRDVALVESFASHHGLQVTDRSPEARSLALTGTPSQIERAFHVSMSQYDIYGEVRRVRESPIHIPVELEGVVEAVLGVDDGRQVAPYVEQMNAGASTLPPFTPTEIANLYRFPPETDGDGQTVAVLEFGGGVDLHGLTGYLGALGTPVPPIVAKSVDGADMRPGIDRHADFEAMVDVAVLSAVAPGATIALYFAPNSARGFADALRTAIHDPHYRPCAISIGWGMSEVEWSAQARALVDSAFQEAALLGITIVAASGAGTTIGPGRAFPDYPASSPFVLSCGGTAVERMPDRTLAEHVWSSSPVGGRAFSEGISSLYPVPDWQAAAHAQYAQVAPTSAVGRGVPDVAGSASPQPGYSMTVNGVEQRVGGTSVAAPLWAGLIARLSQALGASPGFLNPLLYRPEGNAFRDVRAADEGLASMRLLWNPCTGLGTPDGEHLLTRLVSKRAATHT